MSIGHDAIRKAIRDQLLTLTPVSFATTVLAWENRPFSPPEGALWIRESYMPNFERLVATNQVQASGISEFAVFYPIVKGTETPETVADAIKNLFKPATSVGGFIAIDRSERRPGRKEEPWWVISVSISWRTYSTNT